MALLTLQPAVTTGLEPVFSAPTVSDTITATGSPMLYYMKCSGATVQDFTIIDAGHTPAGAASVNFVIAIPATGELVVPIPPQCVDPGTGLITVTYQTSVTGVTAALIGI